MRWWIICFCTF